MTPNGWRWHQHPEAGRNVHQLHYMQMSFANGPQISHGARLGEGVLLGSCWGEGNWES